MKKKLAMLCVLMFPVTANAALYDRGNGLIYDDALDITWMQDATSGNGLDVAREWMDAVDWVEDLVYEGHDGWRLPSLSVSGGIPTGVVFAGLQVDCATATEFECRDNELGYMFYYNLAGSAGDSLTGDQGLFSDIQYAFWTGTQWGGYIPGAAWGYNFSSGHDFAHGKTSPYYVWAVADGDISPVPIPATAWLFGSALFGLGMVKRKKA